MVRARGALARALALLVAAAGPAVGQAAGFDVRGEVFVGSEMERYLRVLQVAGKSPVYPWAIRSFSPSEVERLAPADSAHPWAGRYRLAADTAAGLELAPVFPEARLVYNSAFPYGDGDGAVWAGRGLTASLQGGGSVRYGPVSLTLAPIVYYAGNSGFELQHNGEQGHLVYADGVRPYLIDLPQRFGDDSYLRVDPGQSTLRVDGLGLAAGVSTANQQWGPAAYYPIVLGNNAPGFAHLFLGTQRPLNVGLGRIHARFFWGRLGQSDYSTVAADSANRLMTGLVAVFTPAGVPGLELGLGRFHQALWPSGGLERRQLFSQFESFLKVNVSDPQDTEVNRIPENQLASVFARWVFPRSGMEVYGEFARDDHNWDMRDLLLEPDHQSAYLLGLGKVWRTDGSRFVELRGEVLNAQPSHLTRVRSQGVFYYHTRVRQGHTHQGQLLGSPAAYGGAGSTVALNVLDGRGRWSVAWSRELRADDAPVLWGYGSTSRGVDALHSLSGEAVRFRGPWELAAGLVGVYDHNRDFTRNAFNANLSFSVRTRVGRPDRAAGDGAAADAQN